MVILEDREIKKTINNFPDEMKDVCETLLSKISLLEDEGRILKEKVDGIEKKTTPKECKTCSSCKNFYR